METNVVAMLTCYKRQANMEVIIPALRAQTVKPRIVLLNTGEPYVGPEPDDLWQIPFATGAYVRHQIACFYDGWLYYNDDDLVPTNDRLLEMMVRTARLTCANAIVGARARDIWPEAPHYKHKDAPGPWTNNVKGGCMMMHRSVLERVRVPPFDMPHRCDDIHVSLEAGRGKMVHWVDWGWEKMIRDLSPQDRPGYCKDPEHYDERERYCRQWLAKNSI